MWSTEGEVCRSHNPPASVCTACRQHPSYQKCKLFCTWIVSKESDPNFAHSSKIAGARAIKGNVSVLRAEMLLKIE